MVPVSLPTTVGIIPDGNRRWARERGLPPHEGHRAGAHKAVEVVRWAREAGVHTLVLYVFSTENWRRQGSERRALWGIVRAMLAQETEWRRAGVCVRVVGQRSRLPRSVRQAAEVVEHETARQHGMRLVLAISYGGRWEMVEAARTLAARGGPWTPDAYARALPMRSAGVSEVDLIIRTGGESRLSNFLLWEAAYASLAFTSTLWPAFSREEFDALMQWYGRQEHRRGR